MDLKNINEHLSDLITNKSDYRSCSIGVLDNISDPNINFDENGICNYYHEHTSLINDFNDKYQDKEKYINEKIDEIKSNKNSSKYDSIIGLSGGVDSSYLCLYAKSNGLNPLIIHFDNGWNSEIAQKNIELIVNELEFDLYTHVVDWDEFKIMQRAYINSSVVDVEVLTDHAFMSLLFQQAKKWNIKYVLAGTNIKTESILPSYWVFSKRDKINLVDIINKNGEKKFKSLKSYPSCTPERRLFYDKFLDIEFVEPLNFINYDTEEAKTELYDKLGWKKYGGKHHESIWTRFYQGYILPIKFNIDKRKAHLSNLIYSDLLSKDEAINILASPTYDTHLMKEDYLYVLKKLGYSFSEFEKYLKSHRVEHTHYDYDKGFRNRYKYIWFLAKYIKR